MAGMFYSLKEVTAKLNKTEEQVKEIVHQGRLREFRTGGSEVLFKIDEVEALMSDTRIIAIQKAPAEETTSRAGACRTTAGARRRNFPRTGNRRTPR
jgi:excisionase family DNA binding protein